MGIPKKTKIGIGARTEDERRCSPHLSSYPCVGQRTYAYAKSHTQRITKGAETTRNVIPVDLGQAERVDEMGWDGRTEKAKRALSYSR